MPNRLLYDMKCPDLVEKKKGVRFVCKGEELIDYVGYTVRVRAGFSHDGGEPTIFRVQRVPGLSP